MEFGLKVVRKKGRREEGRRNESEFERKWGNCSPFSANWPVVENRIIGLLLSSQNIGEMEKAKNISRSLFVSASYPKI
jgi:hypothetical protein